jgi:hypothetical protein
MKRLVEEEDKQSLDKERSLKKFCLPQTRSDRIASAVADACIETPGRDEKDTTLLLSDKPIVLRCHCEEEYYSRWLLYWPQDQTIGERLLRWLDEMHSDHVSLVWALQWCAEHFDRDVAIDESQEDLAHLKLHLGISNTAQLGYLRYTVNPLGDDAMQKEHCPVALETLDARLFVVDCHAFE